VEELLSAERGEELCAAMLVSLHDNLRGLVEGESEWEQESSSSKMSVLFKLLHELVRLLTKTGQRLPFVGGASGIGAGGGAVSGVIAAGYSPFEPFAMCAVYLAQQQVDVGRRMDLSSSLTLFLKSLALYDADFQTRLINSAFRARSDILAQAVVEQAAINPKPLFVNVATRLQYLSKQGKADEGRGGREAGGVESGGAGGTLPTGGLEGGGGAGAGGAGGVVEWMFALHLLSLFSTSRSPRAHEMADTPLFLLLIDSILKPPPLVSDNSLCAPTVKVLSVLALLVQKYKY
jgi:hypothetical protein